MGANLLLTLVVATGEGLPANFNENTPRSLMMVGLLSGGLLLARWYFQKCVSKIDRWMGMIGLLGVLLALVWQFLRADYPYQTSFLGVLSFVLVLVTVSVLFLPSDSWHGQPPAVDLPSTQPDRDLAKAKLLARYVAQNGKVTVAGGPGLLSVMEFNRITQLHFDIEQLLTSVPPQTPTLSQVQQLQLEFAQLRAVAQPVTEETLLDTQRNPSAPRSRAALRLDVCGRFMLLAVVSLVLVQAYATIGVKLHGQMTEAAARAIEADKETPKGGVDVSKAEKEEKKATDATIAPVWSKREHAVVVVKNPEFTSAYECVQVWVNPVVDFTRALGFAQREKDVNRNYESGTEIALVKDAVWVGTQAELLIDFLNKYLLPLLYGWAGAAIYAVRRLTRQIADSTYRDGAEDFAVRTWLGCTAGLAIGWFNVGKTASESAGDLQLAPLALAFLAGFAVEILFSLLDRLVRAFTN